MAPASMVSRLKRRVGRLAKELTSAGLEGAIIVPGPNLAYYTGVSAHLYERPFLLLLRCDGEAHLLAPKLESGPFSGSIPLTLHSWDDTEGPSGAFRELRAAINTKRVWGCEGRVPFGFLDHLLRLGIKVKRADGVLQSIREVKEPEELELLRRSAEILSGSILRVPDALREGMTEKELARFILEDATRREGPTRSNRMVQSGPRAADPHSVTSTRKIGRGESVVVDVVSYYDGYAADITRTFVMGRGGEVEKTYRSVLAAQEKAIDSAEAGVATGKVDAAARDSLKRDGLARVLHPQDGARARARGPRGAHTSSRAGSELLRPGMVFTVEPGAYLPGRLGVRIEDDVMLSTTRGSEVTTSEGPEGVRVVEQ